MKVNIGKYIHFWSTTNLERDWFKYRYDKWDFDIKESEKDWLDRSVAKVLFVWERTVCHFVNRVIKERLKRKVKIKIHNYDVWSMDNTLAMIILPMLKKLNEQKHGSPQVDDEDVPEDFRSTVCAPKENEWDTDENWFKRWDWVMSELIWTFEQLNDCDGESQFYSGKADILWQALDKDGNRVGAPLPIEKSLDDNADDVVSYVCEHGPKDTIVIDMEGLEAYSSRIENGLRLFGKYYRGLWD